MVWILSKDFFCFSSGSVQEKVFSDNFDIIMYFATTLMLLSSFLPRQVKP